MNINVRMEGGLGDHLLANRFIPAILDRHEDASIKVFSDTEGNDRTLNVLLKLFPRFYKRGGEVIKERISKNFSITSQFGKENYPTHIDNQKTEIINKFNDCDKFYDLHIDGLKWLYYDFDWLRYFYHFPKPFLQKRNSSESSSQKYLLTHLYSRPDSPYNLEQGYVNGLLHTLSKYVKIVIVIEKQYMDYYNDFFNHPNITINTADSIEDIFQLAKNCKCFLGIDSGIRYIPYHFSKPVFLFSKYCSQYRQVAPSHLVRWLIFDKNVFPLNFDVNIVSQMIQNLFDNPASALFPEILNDLNSYIVKRHV